MPRSTTSSRHRWTPPALTRFSNQSVSIVVTLEDQMKKRPSPSKVALACDTTCTNSFSASNLLTTIFNPGSASSAAEDFKRKNTLNLWRTSSLNAETSDVFGSAGCSLQEISPQNFEGHLLHLSTDLSRHHPLHRADNYVHASGRGPLQMGHCKSTCAWSEAFPWEAHQKGGIYDGV